MRVIRPILIFLFVFNTVLAGHATNNKMTLIEARGLKKGNCYKEVAALSCEGDCVLDFFPTSQAQLSLRVQDISKQDRKRLGRFFDVEFLYSDEGAAKILKLSPLDLRQIKERLKKSDGLFRKTRCSK